MRSIRAHWNAYTCAAAAPEGRGHASAGVEHGRFPYGRGMAATGYRLAIDFGTSTTVAMLAGPDGRTIPLLFDASPLLPSAVCAGEAVLTGADALRAGAAAPAGFE